MFQIYLFQDNSFFFLFQETVLRSFKKYGTF